MFTISESLQKSGFSLRQGAGGDFTRLSEIKFEATRLFGADYVTETLKKETLDRFAEDENLYVAVDELGRVCGYSGAYAIDGDLYLEHLFVAKDSAGRGVGSILLEAVVAKAELTQCRAVTLITSGLAPWNAPFYKKKGFSILSDEMPQYLQKFLQQDIEYFDPNLPFVKSSPLILPRVAMEKPTIPSIING